MLRCQNLRLARVRGLPRGGLGQQTVAVPSLVAQDRQHELLVRGGAGGDGTPAAAQAVGLKQNRRHTGDDAGIAVSQARGVRVRDPVADDGEALRTHGPLDDRLGVVTGGGDGGGRPAASLGGLGEVRAWVIRIQLVLVGHQIRVQPQNGRVQRPRFGLCPPQPVPVEVHVVRVVPQERLGPVRVRHGHDHDRRLFQIARQRRVVIGLHERVDERQRPLRAGRLMPVLAAKIKEALRPPRPQFWGSRRGIMQRDQPERAAFDGAAQARQRHPVRVVLVVVLERLQLLKHGNVARRARWPLEVFLRMGRSGSENERHKEQRRKGAKRVRHDLLPLLGLSAGGCYICRAVSGLSAAARASGRSACRWCRASRRPCCRPGQTRQHTPHSACRSPL